MVFSSNVFLFFFLPIVLALYYVVKNRIWRNVVLLVLSLVFYAWGEPVYVLLMIGSIIYNWGFALLVARAKKAGRPAKRWLVAAIVVNIAAIGFFKYTDFLIGSINAFGASIDTLGIALPIGISFYTFQALSYVIDVYRGQVEAQKNVLYVGTYIAMFPQLIAGPIVRYTDIAYEMEHRHESLEDFTEGVRRFIIGFAKKVLLANTMAQITSVVADTTTNYLTFGTAWFGIIAFTFQIYFDFSGYSDMAIGLGRMFGFHFLENFSFPYISRSITDFWRRWHISLSSFFRDYVYIPLGGNRVSKPRWLLNIIIVWALTGLWHGASWNYVLWGAYFGVILIIEKLLFGKRVKLPPVIGNIYALILIVVGWVIFWREDTQNIIPYLRCLVGDTPVAPIYSLRSLNILQFWPWFIVCAVCSTPLLARAIDAMKKTPVRNVILSVLLLGVFVASIMFLVTSSYNPFIYYRF